MKKFCCRERELKVLNSRYEKGNFECIVLYGRRRIGKTALINEFCKDKPSIFFSALNTTARENLKLLSRAVTAFERPDSAAKAEFESYEDVFEEISDLASKERIIFVIDEYPYLAKAYPSISAMLQHVIDHKWSSTGLFLILCGSSMSFMEHQVLGAESPLYGRRTGQLKIEPLDYRDTAVFNPELSYEDNALIYGITGGVPDYINKLDVKENLDEALMENFFEPSSYLYEEPSNLLKQELREPAVYNAIIKAVASGASKLNQICTRVGESSAVTVKYIKTLEELGILKKETPITQKPGKRTIYLLSDNFFRFWYRFVPDNSGAICSGRTDKIYFKAIKPYFSDYMGLVFEKMCRDYLLFYAEDLPASLVQIGQWWGNDPEQKKEIQIDIVGKCAQEDEYIIGSCKYRNSPAGLDELKLLSHYASVFGKGSRYYFYIFSKGGFEPGLLKAQEEKKVCLLTLEDLYRKS